MDFCEQVVGYPADPCAVCCEVQGFRVVGVLRFGDEVERRACWEVLNEPADCAGVLFVGVARTGHQKHPGGCAVGQF